NPDNVVLAMTVSGFIPPSEASTTFFDPNVLYQWKIDNNGDAVEDLVIQAFVTGNGGHQVMHFRGPAAPRVTGATSRVIDGPETATVPVTNGASPIIASHNGTTVFAGVRDDPFFFDLVQFKKIIAGQATSFRDPGVDSFAGTNVLAIVVELPSALLGGTKLGVWGTTSRQQFQAPSILGETEHETHSKDSRAAPVPVRRAGAAHGGRLRQGIHPPVGPALRCRRPDEPSTETGGPLRIVSDCHSVSPDGSISHITHGGSCRR